MKQIALGLVLLAFGAIGSPAMADYVARGSSFFGMVKTTYTIKLNDDILRDVDWCLSSAADSTIAEQASAANRPYCYAALAGSLYSGLSAYIAGRKQNEWSRDAGILACDIHPNNQMTAVVALAACQCHSTRRAERILKDRQSTIKTLRLRLGCSQDVPIIP